MTEVKSPEQGIEEMRTMRTRPLPNCYLCGTPGEPLYENISDKLFGAPGKWTLKRCLNTKCSLIWLDPMPLEEDIAIAYQTYYTHGPKPTQPRPTLEKVLAVYRKSVKALFSALDPLRRGRENLDLMFLAEEAPGRVLEVGCGSAARLAKLRDLGWQVFGQDVDPRAAAAARDIFQLDVHLGPLAEADFPEEFFDFLILNHVIEHVHDPVLLLVQCRRLLKKGGQLILVTPNSKSIGHRWFGVNWRGLEPPRHIFIFSPATLPVIAGRSGFSVLRSWTTSVNAHVFSDGSLLVRHEGSTFSFSFRMFRAIYRTAYLYCSSAATILKPNVGEECVLKLES